MFCKDMIYNILYVFKLKLYTCAYPFWLIFVQDRKMTISQSRFIIFVTF